MRHERGHAAHYVRMPRRRRFAVYSIVGALWLSGCLWLYLDQFYAKHGQFGATPHPLESPTLLLHGIAAILSMYLFGWITARHILRWWSGGLRRISGGALTALLIVLVVSGFALFFLIDDELQHGAALIHEVLGLAVTVFAIQHWFFRKRQDRAG
ncbi:MAG TPA: hypothetical protein VGI65_08405 [Steroidobacteraceae bacterium]